MVVAALTALVIAVPATASQHSTLRFKVVSAKATATLTFHTSTASVSEASISDGKVALSAALASTGSGSLPGKATARIKGTITERVKTQQRTSETSPYEEQECSKIRKVSGTGGVTLRRVGSKVEVRWAFPQAKPSFCQGPSASRSITSTMKRLYPASLFNRKAVTLVLSGSKKSALGTDSSLTYRWRATVKLKRS
jgi:hypothetical protein